MKRSELLNLLVEYLPIIVVEEYGQKDTCIPASYHALEVLKRHGIPARLASKSVTAMNVRFAEWFEAREHGDQMPMPPDAWALGIRHDNPDTFGYKSHLVVVTKGRVLDCAAGQMSRTRVGMPVPNGLLVNASRAGGANVWSSDTTFVFYHPSPEPVPPMWTLNPRATARVRERITQLIDVKETEKP